ncbi:hypothetical protein PsorP6_003187 [Peronosclerospora sorghi]|uniref:Uncharacterized protein n=1 Tax=Peronosclerospora sorghi TaxID=230839 RepID=A0ACC0VIU4_9STRA|nr:hypothetical protein PsorP6_003187 [Peronosclerospora sorghi]
MLPLQRICLSKDPEPRVNAFDLETPRPLFANDVVEKTSGMEKQPELTNMLKELLIIVRKCGHILFVSDYMSSVESSRLDMAR